MKLIALMCVLLTGCAGLSVEDRFDLASACQTTVDQECEQLWDEWNHSVEVQKRRDSERNSPCGSGYVLYCDHWCSKTKMRGVAAGECVRSSWY